jgi:hypothetical protein
MSRISWNDVGARLFETGVDRGVLYVHGAYAGVPWNGLVAVSESPSGGEVTPYYIDGIRYLDHVSSEEYQATIEAYTYPEVFNQCDGVHTLLPGFLATQQERRSFDLCYRTLIGNDTLGQDNGYKLHLVYNATASPAERPYSTLTDMVEPTNFSWTIVAKPPIFTELKPTAHFIIDSRKMHPVTLRDLEDILYGSDFNPPHMPSLSEIFNLFNSLIADAGTPTQEYLLTEDGGGVTDAPTSTIDGGTV